jgi:hypothetical protein
MVRTIVQRREAFMIPITFLALGSVVAAVVLVLACAVSFAAEKPPTATGESASVRVCCPADGALARVGLGSTAGGRFLRVLSCERFPDGLVECDRACLATHRAV